MHNQMRNQIASARVCLNIGSHSADSRYMLNLAQVASYFAVYSTLCETYANLQVPNKEHPANKQAWNKAYRILSHSVFSERASRIYRPNLTPSLNEFMSIGIFLKLQRNNASYDYWHNPTPQDALNGILLAEKALDIMDNASIADKTTLSSNLRMIQERRL